MLLLLLLMSSCAASAVKTMDPAGVASIVEEVKKGGAGEGSYTVESQGSSPWGSVFYKEKLTWKHGDNSSNLDEVDDER